MESDSLRLELTVRPGATGGAGVHLTFSATNTTARPLTLYLRGREPTVEIEVRRSGDRATVWRYLEGKVVPAILLVRELAPRGALVVEADWDGRGPAGEALPPGDYVATASLLTEGPSLTAPEIRITLGRSG